MVLSDPIANFLTTIRNGQVRMLKVVSVSNSSVVRSILEILVSEGYIDSFIEKFRESSRMSFPDLIEIRLKYCLSQSPVIKEIIRVSKPGCRVYFSSKMIPKFYNGLGVYILSTSKGVISDFQARRLGVGGEILCGVF